MKRSELVRGDFENPRMEWRRIFAEVFGTFFLVLVAAGAEVVNAVSLGEVNRVAAVVAPGLMVMAIILFMGAISGAHLNPAVSIGFAARGDFPWSRVPGYIAAQLLGATIACIFLWLMFGKVGMLGATEPGPGITDIQAMVMELVLTLGLVSTILGTASKAQNVGPVGRARGGRLHRARRSMGESNQRRIDEPGQVVRSGPCTHELRSLLGLRGGSDCWSVVGCRRCLFAPRSGRGRACHPSRSGQAQGVAAFRRAGNQQRWGGRATRCSLIPRITTAR